MSILRRRTKIKVFSNSSIDNHLVSYLIRDHYIVDLSQNMRIELYRRRNSMDYLYSNFIIIIIYYPTKKYRVKIIIKEFMTRYSKVPTYTYILDVTISIPTFAFLVFILVVSLLIHHSITSRIYIYGTIFIFSSIPITRLYSLDVVVPPSIMEMSFILTLLRERGNKSDIFKVGAGGPVVFLSG
ncbi:hypothetical protein H8356DRAFT_1434265 [Neocallimastix lanati (nom. inval.)]|nr:hypothetical protein H8356DRAFT_1434265 [Neocallimastix sp. JGI-2020a]